LGKITKENERAFKEVRGGTCKVAKNVAKVGGSIGEVVKKGHLSRETITV